VELDFNVYINAKDTYDESKEDIAVMLAEVITNSLEGVPWVLDFVVRRTNARSTQDNKGSQAGGSGASEHGGEEAQC
jgi:hypothetical protein